MADSGTTPAAANLQLVRSGLGSIGLKIINTLLGFMLTITLARLLGPEGYGTYALAFSILTLLAIPLISGMPHLLVRETAKALAEGNPAMPHAIWRWNTHLILLLTILLCSLALSLWFHPDWLSSPRRETIAAGLLLAPLMALLATQSAMIRGLGRVIAGQIPYTIIGPALFLSVLLTMTWLFPQCYWSPELAISLQAFSTAIVWLISSLVMKQCMPEKIRTTIIPQQSTAWLQSLAPLTVVAGFQLFNSYADILLLGLLRTDSEVGIYRVAVQMSGLVAFGLAAINQILHPQISRIYASNDHARLQKLVTRSARIILLIAIPPVLVFFIAGEFILNLLFGSQYLATLTALKILALGQLLNASFGSVGALLNMTGHEKDTMKGMIVAAGVNILLNLLLIPKFGADGAAISTATSYLIWNWLLRSYVKRRLNIESAGWILKTP